MTSVLVTGAAGFVGSHVARAIYDAGLRVVALDDLSTSLSWPRLPDAIERVVGDVGNHALIKQLVVEHDVASVVHLAGRIRVDESIREPTLYYEQNAVRTVSLLDASTSASRGPLSFVLSSSAAVYGRPARIPVTEEALPCPISPYGASKLAAEFSLAVYGYARGVRWAALRYFNAAGAHPDGTLSERHDPETHLVPLAIDVALGLRPALVVHGDDYPTRDGTCERDYVHVVDLAEAHLAALEVLDRGGSVGTVNLGSTRGSTVKEVLAEVVRVVGRPVPREVGPRRAGDPPRLVASADLAAETLGWRPQRGLAEVVSDAFRSRRGSGKIGPAHGCHTARLS